MRGRFGTRPRAAACFALLHGAPVAAAGAPPGPEPEPPALLLTYCAPPVVPSCIDGLKGHPALVQACVPRAEAYEATVFAYRLCLTRETERAVREANTAMGRLRCAQGRRAC